MGFFWGFFKPLLYLFIFIVIFSAASNVPHYVLFATSGLIFWFFFSNLTSQAVGNIVGSAGLLKSLNIPSVLFPLSEMLSELFNLFLTLIVFLIIMHWYGLVYTPVLLMIIPFILIFGVFTFGLALLLCSVNVFFRDVGIIWGTIQPAIFYLTPIAYAESLIPTKYKMVIMCNPMYHFIRLGRHILYYGTNPPLNQWMKCAMIAMVMYGIGQFVFNRLKNQFISAI